MSFWWRGMMLATCAAAFASCLVYDEDLLEAEDDTGSGGQGGRQSDCDAPEHCPGQDTACAFRTCEAGACGMANAPAETPCSDAGGKICDGMGSCVACVTEAQCQGTELCNQGACVPPSSLADGAACSQPSVCASGHCVDSVCCANACQGFCAACNVSGSEGSCVNLPDGTDPDDECSGGDSCNGSGACQCGDGVENGTESDLDCGGACTPCGFGASCGGDFDCASMSCVDGSCGPLCGDMVVQGDEECDDGNTDPYDGCSPTCLDPTTHLVISEVVVTPTVGEMIEIYNPTGTTIALDQVYLADFNDYWQVASGNANAIASDFYVQFPPGATIAPGAFVVVALQSTAEFSGEHGVLPDYDLDAGDGGAPAMIGDFTGSTGLTNTSEMLVLFSWDGVSNLVVDLDYVVYGSDPAIVADKTGIVVNGSSYLPDTPAAAQVAKGAPVPGAGSSLHRCDTAESSEAPSGGNGSSGHDETSEDFAAAFVVSSTRTPGGPAPAGLCP